MNVKGLTSSGAIRLSDAEARAPVPKKGALGREMSTKRQAKPIAPTAIDWLVQHIYAMGEQRLVAVQAIAPNRGCSEPSRLLRLLCELSTRSGGCACRVAKTNSRSLMQTARI
jgi:hypothetical protein